MCADAGCWSACSHSAETSQVALQHSNGHLSNAGNVDRRLIISISRSTHVTHALADISLKVLVACNVDTVASVLEVLGRDLVVFAGHSRDDDI